jgi:imidazoleglycerol phosphate synthase glutamine amidotransferase subunit HisH
MDVRILPTGPANLASTRAALQRLGATVELADKPQLIHTSRVLVIPGNGAFGRRARDRSREATPCAAPRARARPSPDARHRARAPSPDRGERRSARRERTRRHRDAGHPIPRTACARRISGWNSVTQASKGLITSGTRGTRTATAHVGAAGWRVCWSSHPTRQRAIRRALERGGQMATQFHPELSGRWGEMLLDRWLRLVLGGTLSMEPDADEIGLGKVLDARRSLPRRRDGGGASIVPVRSSDPAELPRVRRPRRRRNPVARRRTAPANASDHRSRARRGRRFPSPSAAASRRSRTHPARSSRCDRVAIDARRHPHSSTRSRSGSGAPARSRRSTRGRRERAWEAGEGSMPWPARRRREARCGRDSS